MNEEWTKDGHIMGEGWMKERQRADERWEYGQRMDKGWTKDEIMMSAGWMNNKMDVGWMEDGQRMIERWTKDG